MSNNTVHLLVQIESQSGWTAFHTSKEHNLDRAWETGARMTMNILADAQYYGNPKSVRFLINHQVAKQLTIQKMAD
jgi:hypothetical protein